jgi:hypothetical protein
MNTNTEISFYVDTLIVESILRDETLIKNSADGGLITGLIQKVKDYVSNHIDPNDKSGSVLNILAPGALSIAFGAMGLGWLGILIGLAMRVFHIDVKGILSSIYDKIKSMIGGDKQVTSAQIDDAVNSAVQEKAAPATEQEAQTFLQAKSSAQQLRDARWLKVAMIEYQHSLLQKTAALPKDFFSAYSARKAKTTSLLGKVLGWVFKIALASAGLLVAGDVVNKFLGRPNALDGTIQQGKPIETAPALPASTQTKFKVKPTYHAENYNAGETSWIEKVPNNLSSIENMLINFAKEVYDGLDGKDSIIRSTAGFQVIRDRIAWYNHAGEGAPLVFLPRYFTSKKQIVDTFIDDVAQKAI